MTAVADHSPEGLYAYADKHNQLPLLQALIGPFLSPDPLASLNWLVEVEEDPDLRFAYTTAAELLRARRGGDQ